MRARLRQRFVGYSCTLWHSVYAALNGVRAVNYLPEDIFFNVFERRLNPRLRRDTYRDKNFHDRLNWPGLPVTVLRVINGELFDHAYRSVDLATGLALARQSSVDEFVVKPSREARGVSELPSFRQRISGTRSSRSSSGTPIGSYRNPFASII